VWGARCPWLPLLCRWMSYGYEGLR
jgi:hypothetical protein